MTTVTFIQDSKSGVSATSVVENPSSKYVSVHTRFSHARLWGVAQCELALITATVNTFYSVPRNIVYSVGYAQPWALRF